MKKCRIGDPYAFEAKTRAASSIPMSHQEIEAFINFIKSLKAGGVTVFTNAHQALSVDKVEVGVVLLWIVLEGMHFRLSMLVSAAIWRPSWRISLQPPP